MPLSDVEIRKQVIPDVKDKLILERKLRRKIRTLDKSIVSRFQSDLLRGETTRADIFQDELKDLLFDFYGSVSSTFKTRTLKRLSNGRNPLTSDEKKSLKKAVTVFASRRALQQSKTILETTQKNMRSAMQLAASETVDQIETALNGSAILSRKLKSRETGIVSLETQAMAEATKMAEADMIAKKEPLTLQTPLVSLTKEWVTQGDERVRSAHVSADSQLQRVQDLYIVMGEQLRFPGDTSFGATAANVINCLHPNTVVDASDIRALTRRHYEGTMVGIQLSRGNKLSVTPNHPILTPGGWVFAKTLKKGSRVLGSIESKSPAGCFDIQNVQPTIKEKFNSWAVLGCGVRYGGALVNFHGEIPDKDINIVFSNSLLLGAMETHTTDQLHEYLFSLANFGKGALFSHCLLNSSRIKKTRAFCLDSFVCFFSVILPFCERRISHSLIHRLGSIPRFDATPLKSFFNAASSISSEFVKCFYRKPVLVMFNVLIKYFSMLFGIMNQQGSIQTSNGAVFSNRFLTMPDGNTKFSRTIIDRRTRKIVSVDIIGVNHYKYAGYVYNLETKSSVYLSNGIINHNCRCHSVFSRD